jgi:hypothetical protein
MKPYTLTITAEEQGKVYRALKAALFCAEQQASINVIGAQQIVGQIKDALEIMNRTCEGGFESQQERDGTFMESFAADCAAHGCD